MNNNYINLDLDENGFPVLREDEPEELTLANAKFNKTHSNVVGQQRATHAGNPWFDPALGRFAHRPPGMDVHGGSSLLKGLTNGGRAFVSAKSASLGATSVGAEPADHNKIKITLLKGQVKVATFVLPSATTPRDKTTSTDNITVPEDHQEGPDMFEGHATVPPGVDPTEWAKRADTVRSLAREMDDMGHGDVKQLIAERLKRPLSDGELNQIVHDIRAERINTIVDWLDRTLRKTSLITTRRAVKVVPPKGWVRNTVAGLQDDEIHGIIDRLEALGHDRADVTKNLIGRFSKPRQEQLKSVLGDTSSGKV